MRVCMFVHTRVATYVCMHVCPPLTRPQCLFIAEQMYIAADANVVAYPEVFAQLRQGWKLTGRLKGTGDADTYQGPFCYHICLH